MKPRMPSPENLRNFRYYFDDSKKKKNVEKGIGEKIESKISLEIPPPSPFKNWDVFLSLKVGRPF